jgi:hypothetical protein
MAAPLVFFAVHVLGWGDPPSARRSLLIWGAIFRLVSDARAFDGIVTGDLFTGLLEGLVTGQKWAMARGLLRAGAVCHTGGFVRS